MFILFAPTMTPKKQAINLKIKIIIIIKITTVIKKDKTFLFTDLFIDKSTPPT